MLVAINTIRDEDVRRFFLICFSVCVRKVSLADPRLAVPVRLRFGQYPADHLLREKSDALLRRLARVNVIRAFDEIAKANIVRMEALNGFSVSTPARAICADSRKLSAMTLLAMGGRLQQSKPRLIITSPPYPGAQKYIRSSSLSLGWLGLAKPDDLMPLKKQVIGREEFRREEYATFTPTGIPSADRLLTKVQETNAVRAAICGSYLRDMQLCVNGMAKLLAKGGHMVLVAADNCVCGREFQTTQYLKWLCKRSGLALTLELIDGIRSRALMTKRNSTAGVIHSERVLVFKKG